VTWRDVATDQYPPSIPDPRPGFFGCRSDRKQRNSVARLVKARDRRAVVTAGSTARPWPPRRLRGRTGHSYAGGRSSPVVSGTASPSSTSVSSVPAPVVARARSRPSAVSRTVALGSRASTDAVAATMWSVLALPARKRPRSSSVRTHMSAPRKRTTPALDSASNCASRSPGGPVNAFRPSRDRQQRLVEVRVPCQNHAPNPDLAVSPAPHSVPPHHNHDQRPLRYTPVTTGGLLARRDNGPRA
jgi:hypothetical protein